MDNRRIAGLLSEVVGENGVKTNEPMKNHTSFRTGGPADIMVTPGSVEEISGVIRICREEKVPVLVIGNGTNLVVRDKGIRGVVLKIFNNFSSWEVKGEEIEAQAGVLLSRLAKAALESSLSGLEFASGIPGTLGGATVMNAGAYDGQMSDVIVETRYLDADGELRSAEGADHRFGYRSSLFQGMDAIIVSTRLRLKKGVYSDIKELMDQLNSKRREKQPLELPSAGSVFKRPEGHFTGKLVEDCGLKGYKIGGAQVSTKHCGFIVNAGNATSQDIISLVEYIQRNVENKFGVCLEAEIKIVGEE